MSWVSPTSNPVGIYDAGIFVDRNFTKMECLSYGFFLPIFALSDKKKQKLIELMRELYGDVLTDSALEEFPRL